MKELKVSLTAGIATPVGATGRYFRVISGTEQIKVSFRFKNGKQYDTVFKVGIGVELPEVFESITLESKITQVVEVAYSMGRIDDSRLVGSVNTTVQPATSYGEEITAVTAQTATKVISENGNRLTATFHAQIDGRLWHDDTVDSDPASLKGIPYIADSLVEIKNTAELWFMANAATTTTVLEDIK